MAANMLTIAGVFGAKRDKLHNRTGKLPWASAKRRRSVEPTRQLLKSREAQTLIYLSGDVRCPATPPPHAHFLPIIHEESNWTTCVRTLSQGEISHDKLYEYKLHGDFSETHNKDIHVTSCLRQDITTVIKTATENAGGRLWADGGSPGTPRSH